MFFQSILRHRDKHMDLKTEPFHSVAASAPEPVGNMLGKLGVVWAGFFAGIKLGDLVLLATLVYTILQICILVMERIIRPFMAARAAEKLRAEKLDSFISGD